MANFAEFDVDEIHDDRPREPGGQILRHLPRKGDDMAHLADREQRADMLGKRGAAEQAVRRRFAAQDCRRERDGARYAAHLDAQAPAKRREFRLGDGGILGRIGERSDMDGRELCQRLEHVPAADAVAAVGGPGRTVDQKQDLGHYPSPRAISGPMRFAAHSGSFFQRSTCSRYLALVGLVSRGRSPGASQRA